jgi:hypothetical protein
LAGLRPADIRDAAAAADRAVDTARAILGAAVVVSLALDVATLGARRVRRAARASRRGREVVPGR